MKNFINSLILVLVIMFFSCKDASKKETKTKIIYKEKTDTIYLERNYKNVSYIDRDLDSTIYKLYISDSNNFIIDNHHRQTVLLSRNIFVGDSCFGGYSNIPKAIQYSKKTNNRGQKYIRIAISILDKNKRFKEVWFWRPDVGFEEGINGGYSLNAGFLYLEEGIYRYKNHNEIGLKINYDFGFPDYKKINSLNFIQEKNKWKLISRESFNTSPKEQRSYFIETTNLHGHYEGELSDTFPPSEKVEITNEMILF